MAKLNFTKEKVQSYLDILNAPNDLAMPHQFKMLCEDWLALAEHFDYGPCEDCGEITRANHGFGSRREKPSYSCGPCTDKWR